MDTVEPPQFPTLVDIETAAEVLAVSVRYVRRMVAEGRIEVIKMGRLLRFDLEKLREYIDKHRRRPYDS
jgi:excisionase family DNA binding protein